MQRSFIPCKFEGCHKMYSNELNLKKHIDSVHRGLSKFKCITCGKKLSSKQNLLDHKNIHTGAKPYECKERNCLARFRQLSQFYVHIQLHKELDNKREKSLEYEKILQFLIGKITMIEQEKSLIFNSEIKDFKIELKPISGSRDAVELPGFSTIDQTKILGNFKD